MTATYAHRNTELNTAGRAYWAMSRMINHGWSVRGFGLDFGGWVRLRTPTGVELPVAADPIDSTPSTLGRRPAESDASLLTLHACRLLGQCGAEGRQEVQSARMMIAALLRLRVPAGRAHSADAQCAWYLPHQHEVQPPASVRRAYWAATTLTDDYGWRITRVDERGFVAVGPYDTEEVPYHSGTVADSTTSALLARQLPMVAADGGTGELERLILEHQRARQGKVGART